MKDHDSIFGSFMPLSQEELKMNSKFMALWATGIALLAVGVGIAVKTGIIWIAVFSAIFALGVCIFLFQKFSFRFTPRFGVRYNFLRFLVGGFIVYRGTAWNGLFGLYQYLHFEKAWLMSAQTFAIITLICSVSIYILSNISLNHITDVLKADFLGLVEVLALVFAFGASFFLILYT